MVNYDPKELDKLAMKHLNGRQSRLFILKSAGPVDADHRFDNTLEPPRNKMIRRALEAISIDIPKFLLDEVARSGIPDGFLVAETNRGDFPHRQNIVVHLPWTVQYPLVTTVQNGSIEVIEWLISRRVNLEARNQRDFFETDSPLASAAKIARIKAVQLLLENSHGVDATPVACVTSRQRLVWNIQSMG